MIPRTAQESGVYEELLDFALESLLFAGAQRAAVQLYQRWGRAATG